MGLEVALHINQLIANNPVGGVDPYSTADDHLRLIKSVLLADFGQIGGAVVASHTELSFCDGLNGPIQPQLDSKEVPANKNIANGYAGLNSSAQLSNVQVASGNVTQHQAALVLSTPQIQSGIMTENRLGSGGGTAAKYLRGDSVWAVVDFSQLSGTSAVVQGSYSTAATPTTLVLRDGNADVYGRYFVNNSGSDDSSTLGDVCYRISAGSGHGRFCSLVRLKRQSVLTNTIASDPGTTPSGSPGDVFEYY